MELSEHSISVGALTKQVKELETIREFLSSVTVLSLIDSHFAKLFLVLITYIGYVWVLVAAVSYIF